MKKYAFCLVVLLSMSAHAVERSGRTNENVIINSGDTPMFTKNVVTNSTSVQISTGSIARAHLVCRNTGAFALVFGTGTLVSGTLSPGYGAYYVGEGTSTLHTYETYNTGTIYATGAGLGSAAANVYCQEDR